jgi:hypothetical protein
MVVVGTIETQYLLYLPLCQSHHTPWSSDVSHSQRTNRQPDFTDLLRLEKSPSLRASDEACPSITTNNPIPAAAVNPDTKHRTRAPAIASHVGILGRIHLLAWVLPTPVTNLKVPHT